MSAFLIGLGSFMAVFGAMMLALAVTPPKHKGDPAIGCIGGWSLIFGTALVIATLIGRAA